MPDIEIKRGYEVLPDNNIRFGIRINNISDLARFDVEVILDFPNPSSNLKGSGFKRSVSFLRPVPAPQSSY